jgi:hypothetical protein
MGGTYIAQAGGGIVASAVDGYVADLAEARANAEFIVTAVNSYSALQARVAELEGENARLWEAMRPFCLAFETRRDAYANRYVSDRELGYANFDKMPDEWIMEHISFDMGTFRRARAALQGGSNG